MAEATLKIEGMSCRHCVMRVKKAIDALAGVSGSDVAVGSATVKFDESKIKKEDMKAAVEKAGYKVISW
ncbi:MAG: cation transporter [Nitrospirae bacterium]|nr:cation transporter [Nitrospirota bacterium]MCL5236219.1 cation transporter [Nitrospirota bacterium]